MGSLPVPPSSEDSGFLHGRQRSNSHRRKAVPERLSFVSVPTSNNDANFNGSDAFLDHTMVGEANWQNEFSTPPTSRFPSQDIKGINGHHSHNSFSNQFQHPHVHPHTRSTSYGSSETHNSAHVTALHATQSTSNVQYQGKTTLAAALSLLMAFPFVLCSLVQVSPFEFVETGKESDGGVLLRSRVQSRYLSFLGVCSLTAATLVTVGFFGEVKGAANSKQPSKGQRGYRDQLLSYTSFRKILERILSVGLPFYATSKLGGERVAIVILVALASELASKRIHIGKIKLGDIWSVSKARKWTFLALALQCASDVFNLTTTSLPIQSLSGFLALAVSILILPWPFPKSGTTTSRGITDKDPPYNSNSNFGSSFSTSSGSSPLISSPYDTELTVASGVLATVISFVVFILSSQETQTLTLKLLLGGSTVAVASALSLLFADSRAILTSKGTIPLAFALGTSLVIQEAIDSHPLLPILFQSGLIMISWIGVCLDTKWLASQPHSHHHGLEKSSRLTRMILHLVEDYPLLHRVFSKKDSRRIIYFMTLNFSFMLIQGVYGFLTGSLGLLSDTVHMFFDCVALAVGLVATVLGERPSSLEYPQGFKMIDSLAGFGNGVLLLAISIEIVYEAIERLASGSQLNRLGELLIVSTGGLIVNVFGLLAFGHHGHSHGPGGHDHDHDHGHDHNHNHSHSHGHAHEHKHSHHEQDLGHNHNQVHHSHHDHHNHNHNHNHIEHDVETPRHHVSHDSFPAREGLLFSPASQSPLPTTTPIAPTPTSEKQNQNINHSHGHDHHDHHHHHHQHHHHHGGSNMHGIYLHVLADMMGSISVIASTILVHYTGWAGWDAIASVAISFFIIQATIPLVKDTAKQLVLYIPESTEFDLREALSGVGQLRGVVNITVPRFWMESGKTSGVMHVVAAKGIDLDDVRARTVAYLKGRDMDVLVQVEREAEGRCWCGGSASVPVRSS